MGTTSGKVIVLGLIATNVIHNSTHVLTNTANLPIRDILHIDYMDTVLISVRNKILSFCDTLSAESLVPKREFLLPPYSPICYKMIKVAHQNERSVEVWGLLGENSSVLRLNLKLNEVNDTQIYTGGYGLTCIAETKSKGKDSSYITRIWVSFHHTLVSFDSITGKEVYNSSEEVSHPISKCIIKCTSVIGLNLCACLNQAHTCKTLSDVTKLLACMCRWICIRKLAQYFSR